MHQSYLIDPSVSFKSIWALLTEIRNSGVDDTKGIFRLPGEMPELTVFNEVVRNLENNLAVLTAACSQFRSKNRRPCATQLLRFHTLKRISHSHLLFNQVGQRLGLFPRNYFRAFLTIWISEYQEEVERMATHIRNALMQRNLGDESRRLSTTRSKKPRRFACRATRIRPVARCNRDISRFTRGVSRGMRQKFILLPVRLCAASPECQCSSVLRETLREQYSTIHERVGGCGRVEEVVLFIVVKKFDVVPAKSRPVEGRGSRATSEGTSQLTRSPCRCDSALGQGVTTASPCLIRGTSTGMDGRNSAVPLLRPRRAVFDLRSKTIFAKLAFEPTARHARRD